MQLFISLQTPLVNHFVPENVDGKVEEEVNYLNTTKSFSLHIDILFYRSFFFLPDQREPS